MRPSEQFLKQPRSFWAYIKLISEHLGYSARGTKELRRYDLGGVRKCLQERGLHKQEIFVADEEASTEEQLILDYLNYRAEVLNTSVRPNLMNREEARIEFEKLQKKATVACSLPYNKQKGEKRHFAYLTGIVNMLAAEVLREVKFEDSPRGLVVVTKDGHALRTLSRWMDGAYPGLNNPRAIWEIKEYYGTTTFGSRVADGVYETMLDGEELRELNDVGGVRVLHYLIVDDRFTWWECGRSYLCRIVDMLHMGLVDEVLFGREVLTRWPEIVKSWKELPGQ